MKPACLDFRAALERSLASRGAAHGALSWHEHLLGCADCRALLEAEEALDLLLATLPEPRLPDDLAARVLSRLRRARGAERELDALLALDLEPTAPSGLAHRVLAGLARERTESQPHAPQPHAPAEARLDLLLERAGRVDLPRDLAARVLAGLETERVATPRSLRAVSAPRRRFLVAVAAAALVALGAWFWFARPDAPQPQPIVDERTPGTPGTSGDGRESPDSLRTPDADASEEAPSDELLAALDALENWDLLMREDLDLLLSTFATADELLLEFEAGDAQPGSADEDGAVDPATGERKG